MCWQIVPVPASWATPSRDRTEAYHSVLPSEDAYSGLLDVGSQHRVQAIPGRDVDLHGQFLLQKLLDANQIEKGKTALGIVNL